MSARNKDDLPENTDSPTLGPSGINHTETRSLETVRDDGSTVFTDIGRPWQMPLYISEADGVSVQNEPGQSRLSNMTTSTKFTDLPERLERNSEQNEQPGQISANITDPSTAQTTGLHNRESSSRELSAHIEAGGFYYDNSSAASDISGGQTTQISQVPRRDPFHIPYDNNRMSALITDFTATPTGMANVAAAEQTNDTKSGSSRAFLTILCCGRLSPRPRRARTRSGGAMVRLDTLDAQQSPVASHSETTAPHMSRPVDDQISRVDFGLSQEIAEVPESDNEDDTTEIYDAVHTRQNPRLSLFPVPPGSAL